MWRGWESWFGLWGRPWACLPPMLWKGPDCSWPRGIPGSFVGSEERDTPGGHRLGGSRPVLGCGVGRMVPGGRVPYGKQLEEVGLETSGRRARAPGLEVTLEEAVGAVPLLPAKPWQAVLGLVLPVVVYWLGSRGSTSGGVPAAPPLWLAPWVVFSCSPGPSRPSLPSTLVVTGRGSLACCIGVAAPLPLLRWRWSDSPSPCIILSSFLASSLSSPPSLSPPFSVSDISSSPLFLAFSFPLLWRYYRKDFLRAFPSRPFAFPLLLLAGTGRLSFTLLSPRLLWPSWRIRGGSPSLVKVGESWLLHCWTVHGSAGALVVIRTRQQQLIHRGGGQWGSRPCSDWVFCQKIQPVKRETSQRILFCQAGSYFGGCEVQINRSQKVWN